MIEPVKNKPKENVGNQKKSFEEYHKNELEKNIEKLFNIASASEFIEINNNLINSFLDNFTNNNSMSKEQLFNVVFLINKQSQFIVTLQENYNNYRK